MFLQGIVLDVMEQTFSVEIHNLIIKQTRTAWPMYTLNRPRKASDGPAKVLRIVLAKCSNDVCKPRDCVHINPAAVWGAEQEAAGSWDCTNNKSNKFATREHVSGSQLHTTFLAYNTRIKQRRPRWSNEHPALQLYRGNIRVGTHVRAHIYSGIPKSTGVFNSAHGQHYSSTMIPI